MQSEQQLPYSISSDEQQIQTIPASHYSNDQTFSLKSLLGVARRRIRLMVAVGVTVFGISLSWSLTRTPIYLTSFQLLVESITPKVVPITSTAEQLNYPTLFQVLRSPKILGLVADSLKNIYPDLNYNTLVTNVVINRVAGTNAIEVSFTNQDPEKARAVAEKLAQTYLNYGQELRETNIQQGINFVDRELPKIQQRYNDLQDKLESFRKRYSLVDPITRAGELSGSVNGNLQQQAASKAKILELQSTYATINKLARIDGSKSLPSSALSESPRYQELRIKLQGLDAAIAAQALKFQADSPQVQVLKDQRQLLVSDLEQEGKNILGIKPTADIRGDLTGPFLEFNKQLLTTSNQLKILQSQTKTLEESEKRLKQDFALAPALIREYNDLTRQIGITSSGLERFLITKENLSIEVAQKGEGWSVISAPYRPNAPISPNTPQNLTLGLLGSLFLAGAAAAIAEKLDDVYHSPGDLQALRLPLLATIPFRQELKDIGRAARPSLAGSEEEMQLSVTRPSKAAKSRAKSKYYSYNYNYSRFIEAFRSLHTSVRLLSVGTPIRSLVISSSLPSEGKSTISYQLAVAAAAMGQRVLLVDADLRRPRVHVRSGLPNQQGLSTAIATDEDVHNMIQRSSLDERLHILTAGQVPPDPTRLLSSPKMRNLMDQLKKEFDLVIYDTPPVLGFADSLLMSSFTDGCIMVVGLGKTERSAVSDALASFQTAGTPLLGMIANCLKKYTTDSLTYGQTYGNYYYTDRSKSDI